MQCFVQLVMLSIHVAAAVVVESAEKLADSVGSVALAVVFECFVVVVDSVVDSVVDFVAAAVADEAEKDAEWAVAVKANTQTVILLPLATRLPAAAAVVGVAAEGSAAAVVVVQAFQVQRKEEQSLVYLSPSEASAAVTAAVTAAGLASIVVMLQATEVS